MQQCLELKNFVPSFFFLSKQHSDRSGAHNSQAASQPLVDKIRPSSKFKAQVHVNHVQRDTAVCLDQSQETA